MTALVGKKTSRISINDDQSVLAFDTDAGIVAFAVFGDCCSESWFADIVGVPALIGGTVSAAEEISMDGYNVDDGRGRQEEDAAYGYKITTDKGICDIVFRNSSNGYYGGWLSGYSESLPEKMTEITEDWKA
jgi:hypothetical protein